MKEIIFNSSWSAIPDIQVKGCYFYRLKSPDGKLHHAYASNADYSKDKAKKVIPLTGFLVEQGHIKLEENGCYLVSIAGQPANHVEYYVSLIKDGSVLPLSDSKISEADVSHLSNTLGLPVKHITTTFNTAPVVGSATARTLAGSYPAKYVFYLMAMGAVTLLSLLALALVFVFL